MLREFWLKLTDARLGAALKALAAPAEGMGDLAASPSSAPAFFRPLRHLLDKAKAAPGSPAASEALSAAEEFAVRLEKVFSDMALHGVAPDAAAGDALQRLQASCREGGALLSVSGRKAALERVRGLCAGAHRGLAAAKAAADRDPSGFPQNLKYSSIYSGLDAAADALERCAEALFKA